LVYVIFQFKLELYKQNDTAKSVVKNLLRMCRNYHSNEVRICGIFITFTTLMLEYVKFVTQA